MNVIRIVVALAAVAGTATLLATGLPAPAVTIPVAQTRAAARPGVISRCGSPAGSCVRIRRSALQPLPGELRTSGIHWQVYSASRAVGWGHLGRSWKCGGRLTAVQMTCVKITLTRPVTGSSGQRYFSRMLFQPATMAGASRWSPAQRRYVGRF